MADILIRGMEMPKNCSQCQMLEGTSDDGLCHAANKWLDDEYFRWYQFPEGDIDDSKPLNCPLDQLPEGHGRLIDADAFCKQIANDRRIGGIVAAGMISYIEHAPTIVPAEGGGEDG